MDILNHWIQIFKFLNYKSIINLTYVSKKINYFVKKDILNLLPKFPDKFIINSIYLKELIKKGFKFSYDINAIIKYCKNIENFKFLSEFKYVNIDKFFAISCKLNNLEIIELMIEKGANDWNLGLEGSCSSGNSEIVELMIQKGANNCTYCYNNKHIF